MRPLLQRSVPQWLLLALAGPFATAQAQDGPDVSKPLAITVAQPPISVPVEGRSELTYELRLTNRGDSPILVKRVVVVATDTSIADFADEALTQRLANVSEPGTIAPGQQAILFVEANAPPGTTPITLFHAFEYSVAGRDGDVHATSKDLTLAPVRPLVLGPPLAGGPWAAVHDPSWPRGHRRVFYSVDGRARLPGRYAIDFIKLDAQGRTTTGNPDSTQEAFGYGDTVLAVADGEVVGLRDDVAESETISKNPAHPLGEGAGNFVALRLKGGEVAFYEHLRPKTARVRIGEQVRRGQAIGALGFTGDTTGPHLHFHLAEANSLLGAEGIPFLFDRFTILGKIPDMAQFGKTKWQALKGLAPERSREWPGVNTVLDFGKGESLTQITTRH